LIERPVRGAKSTSENSSTQSGSSVLAVASLDEEAHPPITRDAPMHTSDANQHSKRASSRP
jgi:hypothetical protein